MLPVLHHRGCFITSCAPQCLDDVGWAACVVEVAPYWTCQELSCQEARAASSLSRGRHRELSHCVVRRPENDNSLRMSRVITLLVLIRRHGPFSSQSSHLLPSLQWLQTGSCVSWTVKASWISADRLHFLAGGFNITFNLPCLITNMKLSAPVKQTRPNRATCGALCSFATSCWHLSKAGGGECNTVCPPEGRRHCLLGGGGHGASVFHHLAIHHNVTQVPACQDSQHALPGVRGVWILGALNQEMIPTGRDSWCGLVVILYML